MKALWVAGAERWAFSLLAAFFLQGLVLIQSMSATADEVPFHLVNGYAYLKTHDYRMSPANPALIRQWLGLPLLFLQAKLDLNKRSWAEADSTAFAYEFFYQDNRAMAERMLSLARFMNLLIGLALGILIFVWSKQFYGLGGGLLSLAFYSFCPNFLAHSSIAHTDLGVSFFSVLGAFFLWKYLQSSDSRDLWFLSLALGFACASKYNALIFGPLFLLILGVKKGWRVSLKAAGLFTAVSFLLIWASYGFEFKPIFGGAVPRVEQKLADTAKISQTLFPGNESVQSFLKKAVLETPVPMPTYILGLAAILKEHRLPYRHYAFGEWTTDTHWYFYLFSFALKMTLPFLCALLLRIIFFKKTESNSKNENTALLLPALAVFLMTFFDTAQVGVRYLFPVIPLLFVWIGGLAKLAWNSMRWRVILGALLFLNLATTLPAFPNYLSYFNPIASALGGGYRYLRGSDVDWGQGLKALKNYMRKEGIEEVTLRYFGPADPTFYGIRFTPLSEEERKRPAAKVYALSAFYLEHAAWAHEMKPTAMIGGCIFVYDFRQQ